jgi:hypothetical protein
MNEDGRESGRRGVAATSIQSSSMFLLCVSIYLYFYLYSLYEYESGFSWLFLHFYICILLTLPPPPPPETLGREVKKRRPHRANIRSSNIKH